MGWRVFYDKGFGLAICWEDITNHEFCKQKLQSQILYAKYGKIVNHTLISSAILKQIIISHPLYHFQGIKGSGIYNSAVGYM